MWTHKNFSELCIFSELDSGETGDCDMLVLLDFGGEHLNYNIAYKKSTFKVEIGRIVSPILEIN